MPGPRRRYLVPHRPSTQPGYLEKYGSALASWSLSLEEFDRTTTTRLRLEPMSVWLGPS